MSTRPSTGWGYRPARAAQDLRRGYTSTTGLILTHGFENPFYARLFNKPKTALARCGFSAEVTAIDAAHG